MKRNFILKIIMLFCVLSLGLTACTKSLSPDGDNQAKVDGIKLIVYDENKEVIDNISSINPNYNKKLTLNANKIYIFNICLLYSGGSASVNILASSIVLKYNENIIVVNKCNDNIADTTYYIKCLTINEPTDFVIQINNLSLELNVCFK